MDEAKPIFGNQKTGPNTPGGLPRINASELANYVVCPESWRLQRTLKLSSEVSERQIEARQKREEWTSQQGLVVKLRKYGRIAYILLFLVAITVFLLENRRVKQRVPSLPRLGHEVSVPDEILFLMLVLGAIIFLWDLFERRGKRLRQDLGMTAESEPQESGELISQAHNLSSKPNSLLSENNFLIPVDIHPTTDKVRDRHVVPMLLHLAILEEQNGLPSPYGILIMGKDQRRTQIKNTPEKQRWLFSLIDEMRSILDGVPAVPQPAVFKCRNCRVKDHCQFKVIEK